MIAPQMEKLEPIFLGSFSSPSVFQLFKIMIFIAIFPIIVNYVCNYKVIISVQVSVLLNGLDHEETGKWLCNYLGRNESVALEWVIETREELS